MRLLFCYALISHRMAVSSACYANRKRTKGAVFAPAAIPDKLKFTHRTGACYRDH